MLTTRQRETNPRQQKGPEQPPGALEMRMPKDTPWTFDEVDALCRRAFMDGMASGRLHPEPSLDDDMEWETSAVAMELGRICS